MERDSLDARPSSIRSYSKKRARTAFRSNFVNLSIPPVMMTNHYRFFSRCCLS